MAIDDVLEITRIAPFGTPRSYAINLHEWSDVHENGTAGSLRCPEGR